MKRVGIIDNLNNVEYFSRNNLFEANATQIMHATGGNTGNVAFVFGVKKLIGNPCGTVHWSDNPEKVRQNYDVLVVCCANQLGAHTDLIDWATLLRNFGLPVILMGLGAQSDSMEAYPELPQGTLEFLKVVRELNSSTSSNVSVRGEFTKSFLETLDYPSHAYGCPSLLISQYKDLGARVYQRQQLQQQDRYPKKIMVASGNVQHPPSAPLEKMLIQITNQYNGDYIIQHPIDMVKLALNEVENISPTLIPFYKNRLGFDTVEEMAEWFRKKALVFADAVNWMVYMRKGDFVLGPRYHGIALAIQSGVPGGVVTIDSRTLELCQTTGIKNLDVATALTLTGEELIAALQWTEQDMQHFSDNRLLRAQQYIDLLVDNGLEPSEHLRNLV